MCTQRNPSAISTQTNNQRKRKPKTKKEKGKYIVNTIPSTKTAAENIKSSSTSIQLASMTKNLKEDVPRTASNDKETTNLTEDRNNKNDSDIKNEFDAEIVKEASNNVTLKWNLIFEIDVYKIEVHHKVKGWVNVVWTSDCLAIVNNLEENFGYIFRVKALKLDTKAWIFRTLHTSSSIVACTLAADPTAICLFRAIKKNQQFLVKRILRRRPALIEYPGPNGYLPLANATAFSDMCIVDVILTHGANVHVGNPHNNRTPLHAFYYGRLSVARLLLNKKANMEAKDIYGLTPSHLAVDANQSEILKYALENGANVEARDECGWTLLMRAVIMESDLSILKLLVTCGACMKSTDMNNLNCEDLARLYGNGKAMEYFTKVVKLKEAKQLLKKNLRKY